MVQIDYDYDFEFLSSEILNWPFYLPSFYPYACCETFSPVNYLLPRQFTSFLDIFEDQNVHCSIWTSSVRPFMNINLTADAHQQPVETSGCRHKYKINKIVLIF